MGIKKRWQQFNAHLLQQRLPHGLVSWCYLLPIVSSQTRQHRALWWLSGNGWPRSVWLAIELMIWVRWLLWYGWVSTRYVVQFHGQRYADRYQLPKHLQYWRTLRLSLGWCIHPRDVYRFDLILDPQRALEYVYDQETGAFHRFCNPEPNKTPTSYACLQDKIALAERLKVLGIPVVATSRVISKASGTTLQAAMQTLESQQLFFKTRSGHQGLGAFALWPTPQGLRGETFEGTPLTTPQEISVAWQALLKRDDVLIQPLLINHPDLAPMSFFGEAITVRFISQIDSKQKIHCLCATLEVPAGKSPQQKTTYSIFPIDCDTGVLKPFPAQAVFTKEVEDASDRILALAPENHCIPYWFSLVNASLQAHTAFLDVHAIAWDWVITPNGPILLEGNVGWGAATPQMLLGGFMSSTSPLSNTIKACG